MKSGIWKKYGIVDTGGSCEGKSYAELYSDLKYSGKNWSIARDYQTCVNHLTGENEFRPGDIYVYYFEKNGERIPEFYIKVMETYDFKAKCKKNYIMFNGSTLGYDGINDEYLPELIEKLREIDAEKNAEFITKLEERYKNYQRLLSLKLKEEYTEEELIFIYLMAYKNDSNLALCLLSGRDIKKDFDSFSDENKANLFMVVCDNPISSKLTITSKEVLLGIAQKGSLRQLPYTSEELIADKKLILEVLKVFFEVIKSSANFDLEDCLPVQYQSDLDVLKLIIEHWGQYSFTFWMWVQKNSELKEKLSNPDFGYELMDTLIRSSIKNDCICPIYESYLSCLPNEVLKDIEDHLLIGPESTLTREALKKENLTLMNGEKKLILARRELRREHKKA